MFLDNLLDKILIFALIFAILLVIRDTYMLIFAFKKEKEIDFPIKRQILLGCAISYIFTIIFTGIKLL